MCRFRLKTLRSWARNLSQDIRGDEVMEAALVLPLLFLFLMAVFWFGQAFRMYGAITQAARQGARAAVAPACTTCTGTIDPSQNAYNAIQSALLAARLDPTQLNQPTVLPPVCSCSSGSGTNCSGGLNPPPAACDGGQSQICVQGVTRTGVGAPATETNVQLSSVGQGGAGECGISVSFQYPFKLSLPFTSIGNQTINLRAQAQMRAETQ